MKKDFDLVMLEFGYYKFAVPREFAFKIFEAAQGADFYQLDSKYENGVSTPRTIPIEHATMPKIGIINPVVFYTGIEMHKMDLEKERTKNAT